MSKYLQLISLSLFTLQIICSCGGETKEQVQTEDTDTTTNVMQEPGIAEFEFFNIVSNMPTPLDELGDMSSDGVKFNNTLLAPLDNADKHTDVDAIAINCGIYIVDMTYQAVFHEQKEILNYSQAANKLAAKFEAEQIFNQDIATKMKSKMDDKDSLQVVIEKGLEAMEEHLIDNKRLVTATQMLTGSWVEMQYILTQSMLNLPDAAKDLKQHVFAQRVHLDNLLLLLNEFKDEAGLHDELEKLNTLEDSFTKIHEADEVTHDILVEVANEIKEIRTDLLAM